MLKQANHFYKESKNLYKVLKKLHDSDFEKKTLFKQWSFNAIIRHLHVWNYAAYLSLKDTLDWIEFSRKVNNFFSGNKQIKEFEKEILGDLKGTELLKTWKEFFNKLSESFKHQNPKRRVKWVGPDMSVISSISARHMETWAHGQAIFDALGLTRKNTDSILNIVIIGNNTFKWTYNVNRIDVPDKIPYLKLISPSGKIWKFNEFQKNNRIEGKAEEFCQVVTQVRNFKDLNLNIVGPIANHWMSIAQCFAGKPEKPPSPGSRVVAV